MDLTNLPVNLEALTALAVGYGVRILGALLALAAAWVAAGWIAGLVRDAMDRSSVDGTVSSFTATAVRWMVRGLGLLLCLSVFGIEATSLAALLGGAGVAVGIALKGNLSNLASGLILLAFRPFRDGDYVQVGDRIGTVAKLGLMQLELDTLDNKRHWIPNSQVIETGLTNYQFHHWRRVDVDVGVAYDTDLDAATEALVRAAHELSSEQAGRDPVVRAWQFGASSIDFTVGVWAESPDYLDTRHALVLAIKRALDEAGIEIPFPYRTLTFKEPLEISGHGDGAAKAEREEDGKEK